MIPSEHTWYVTQGCNQDSANDPISSAVVPNYRYRQPWDLFHSPGSGTNTKTSKMEMNDAEFNPDIFAWSEMNVKHSSKGIVTSCNIYIYNSKLFYKDFFHI